MSSAETGKKHRPKDKRVLAALFLTVVFGYNQTAFGQFDNSDDRLEWPAENDSSRVFGGQKVPANSILNDKVLYLAQDVVIETIGDATKIRWKGHCTASALSEKIVMTAAHCVDQVPLGEIYINTSRYLDAKSPNLKNWFRVSKIKIHPGYQSGQGKESKDLALLFLEKDLPFKHVLRLARSNMVHVPMRFLTIGYGRTVAFASPDAIQNAPKGLYAVEKTLMNFSPLKKTFFLRQSDYKGFCKGDSGSPGLIQDPSSGEYLVLGVASFASLSSSEKDELDPNNQYTTCIGKGHYTNLTYSKFHRWILDEIKGSKIGP